MTDPLVAGRFRQDSSPAEFTEEQAVQRIFIPVMSRGIGGLSIPERAMTPNDPELPFWRGMSGFEIHEGPLAPAGMVSDGDEINPPDLSTLGPIRQFGIDYYPNIIVSSEEIWYYNGSAWVSLTPQYSEGDCTVTNGSNVITFSGSAGMNTRGQIQQGQLIDPGNTGTFYRISSVVGNKRIEIASNWTGSSQTDIDYTIRQTFRCENGMVRSKLFNNDLVVMFSSNVQDKLTGIVQVENIFRTSPPAAVFLVSNEDRYKPDQPSKAIDKLSEVNYFTDIELHTDGRVLASANITDDTEAATAGNRVYNSSPADRTRWIAEPGGFTDVVGIRGDVNAYHRYGEQMLVHLEHGVMAGFESGEADPPIKYEINPQVAHGTTHARAVQNTEVGQFYPFLDSTSKDSPQVYLFDGSSAVPIADSIRDFLAEGPTFTPGRDGRIWAYADQKNHTYHLMISEWASGQNRTADFAYHWGAQQWTRTLREENLYGFGTEDADLTTAGKLVSSNADSGSLDKWVHVLTNDASLCTTSSGFLHSDGRFLRSEWLDARRPGYDKSWLQVLLWLDARSFSVSSLPTTCQLVARDDSDASPRATTAEAKTVSIAEDNMQIVRYSFDPFLAEAIQVRLAFDTSNGALTLPDIHHMAVDFALIGQTEASGGLV